MPEQGGADVDGQPAVDELSGEDPPEVVGGEGQPCELGPGLRQGKAGALQHALDGVGGQHRPRCAELPLEQERHRLAPDPLVLVVTRQERDRGLRAQVAADDRGDDGEQLSRHGDDAFAVGLGRRDHQQRGDFAVRAPVLPDAEMSQLRQFLDAAAGVPEGFHDRPFPERPVLFGGDVERASVGLVDDPRRHCPLGLRPVLVVPAVGAPVAAAVVSELLAGRGLPRRGEKAFKITVVLVDVLGEHRQERLALTGPVGHALHDTATAAAAAAEFAITDRAGHRPARPPFWLGDRPALKVKVEGADRQLQGVEVLPGPPVRQDRGLGLPLLVSRLAQPQITLGGVDPFDGGPEQAGQSLGESFGGGVVDAGRTAGDVVDQQVPHLGIRNLVAVDHLGDRARAPVGRPAHRGRGGGREPPHQAQEVPGLTAGQAVLAGGEERPALDAVVEHPFGGHACQADPERGHGRRDVELGLQLGDVAFHAGIDEIEERIQQRVVLHLAERLGIAGQPVGVDRAEAGADHPPLEQHAHAAKQQLTCPPMAGQASYRPIRVVQPGSLPPLLPGRAIEPRQMLQDHPGAMPAIADGGRRHRHRRLSSQPGDLLNRCPSQVAEPARRRGRERRRPGSSSRRR